VPPGPHSVKGEACRHRASLRVAAARLYDASNILIICDFDFDLLADLANGKDNSKLIEKIQLDSPECQLFD
jgi:hypothetical protein